ncbi:MAG: DoxX family protein [Acidobacteriota bacterium]
MSLYQKIINTDAPAAVIIIRLMVGAVFLSEGIQKFLFASELGVGRFAKIGIPNPDFFGPLVGTFEILCGTLVLLGLFTRLALVPLLIIISVAIATTKLAMLPEKGFWTTAHEGRTDYAMFLSIIFLLIVGAGVWSLDARLAKRRDNS